MTASPVYTVAKPQERIRLQQNSIFQKHKTPFCKTGFCVFGKSPSFACSQLVRLMRLFLLTLFFAAILTNGWSQDFSLYRKELFIQGKDTMRYRILWPDNYKPTQKYPLIVVLHGSGERGNDNETQLIWGGSLFMQDSIRRNYPAIVIFPQCPAGKQWTTTEGRYDSTAGRKVHTYMSGVSNKPAQLVIAMIDQLVKRKKVNAKQIYLGGISMGGFGTYVLAAERPDLFAAIFPICGGGETKLAERYNSHASWWLFHGANDTTVDPKFSRNFYQALRSRNFDVKYTEYPGVNHNSWINAFQEPQLLSWMFSHTLY